MNKLKAMLIKDYYASRKLFITSSLTFVLFQIIIYLIRFAYIYGNLADPSYFNDSDTDMVSSMNNLDIIFPIMTMLSANLIFSMIIVSPLFMDFKCRWYSFSFTTSVTEKDIAAVKIIECAASVAASLILGLIFNGIYCMFFSNEYSKAGVLAGTALLMIFGILSLIYLSIALALKKQQSVQVILLIFMCAIYGICGGLFVRFADVISEINIFDMAISWISEYGVIIVIAEIFIFIITAIISYIADVNILKRREKVCGD